MAIITIESLSKIKTGDEFIEFIGLNRYKPENSNILDKANFELLPDYTGYVILILDFETEYLMQDIETKLENSVGHYMLDAALSFERTGNIEIGSCIKEILKTLIDYNLIPDKIRNAWKDDNNEFNIIKGSFLENKELRKKIQIIDRQLATLLVDGKPYWFWDNVTTYLGTMLA